VGEDQRQVDNGLDQGESPAPRAAHQVCEGSPEEDEYRDCACGRTEGDGDRGVHPRIDRGRTQGIGAPGGTEAEGQEREEDEAEKESRGDREERAGRSSRPPSRDRGRHHRIGFATNADSGMG